MARWRLTASHYLMLDPPTKWRQKETDRETGEEIEHEYPVPKLLDIQNPRDYNHADGIIVANKNDPLLRRQYIYLGPPTPDMEPLDEEAQAITDEHKHKWIHPIESMPANGADYGANILLALEKQMAALLKGAQPAAVPVKGIDPDAFTALQEQVRQLMEQNAKLLDQLTAKPEPAPVARRA